MKAVVYTRLGPPEVLQVMEVAKPVPTEKQVLVQVVAASANALDYRRFSGQLAGARVSPVMRIMDGMVLKAAGTILGADIAGRVAAVGAAVTQFQPGDAVFGVAAGSKGGFAEYACASERAIALKPANVGFQDAAAVPVAALTALQALRDKAQVQAGQKVLVYGAAGGVGTFAVQLAKFYGAEVTAVCSPRNVEQARAMGANAVIDYTKEDFTKNGQQYDLILAVNGDRSIFDYRRALRPGGMYLAAGGAMGQIFQGMLVGPVLSRFGKKRLGFMGISKVNPKDLVFLAELLAAGKIRPVIEKCYPLEKTAEAMRYLAGGHAQGKVIIQIEESHKGTEQ